LEGFIIGDFIRVEPLECLVLPVDFDALFACTALLGRFQDESKRVDCPFATDV
jgi:hypothetical protein